MRQIRDRVIVVSGAAGGMGRAIVAMLAGEGARLALADANEEGLRQVEQSARESGAQVLSGVADVRDEAQVQAFFARVKETYGHADVLINLPGLSRAAKVEQMSLADYDLILDVNLQGTFLCSKHFIALVDAARGGQIVNTASMAARRANANAPVYCAAKAAVAMFSEGLALQVKEKNIRVSTLYPGPTDTVGFWGNRPVPRETFMRPENVAEVVRFILSLPPHVVVHDVAFESFDYYKR